jgi:hypothetical protein
MLNTLTYLLAAMMARRACQKLIDSAAGFGACDDWPTAVMGINITMSTANVMIALPVRFIALLVRLE